MSSLSTTLNSASTMRPCFNFGHFAVQNTFTIVDSSQQQIQSSVSNDDLDRMRSWFKSEHQSTQQQPHSVPQKTEAKDSSFTVTVCQPENRDSASENPVITFIENAASTSTNEQTLDPDSSSGSAFSENNTESLSKLEQLKEKMKNYHQQNLKRAKSWDLADEDKSPILRKKSDPMFCSSSLPTSVKERRCSSWSESSFQALAKTEILPQVDIQTGLWGINYKRRKSISTKDSFDENEEEDDDATVTSSVQCDSTTKYNAPAPKKGSGQIHLYAFLLQLLENVENDEQDICWLDRSNREFKLVNPNRVATKWGSVKHKPNMTYEKMSRALRYYYRKNIIEKVREHQYVYRFTEKVNMNLSV